MVCCHQCGTINDTGERVGRRDTCSKCDADLHICLNCQFYDPQAYNECRETQADRVVEKSRANFCDYFIPLEKGGNKSSQAQDKAKAKLEALFKK